MTVREGPQRRLRERSRGEQQGAIEPVDAFVSYDERQSAAARLTGLRTIAPDI